jgi:hypothetical protein
LKALRSMLDDSIATGEAAESDVDRLLDKRVAQIVVKAAD